MVIEFRCPKCQQKYTAPETAAGKVTRCKKCSGPVTIPSPASDWGGLVPLDSADEDSLLDEPLTLRPLEPTSLPQSPPVTPLAHEASAPRARKRVVGGGVLGRLSGAWLCLIVLGLVLLWIGNRERRLGALAKSTPQRISLEQLVATGPGDNIYLELTDVQLLLEQAVIQTERQGLGPERWTYAWIPAVPASAAGAMHPTGVKVVVGSGKCHDDAALSALAMQTELRGIIVNETDKLGSDERKLLSEGLPGIDFSTCYFFREGQGPGNATVTLLLLLGGAVAFLLGGAIAVYSVIGKVRSLR